MSLDLWARRQSKSALERAESVSPTLVSIVPPIQAVIDAGMVADAGGEKSASRSG
jgi:hypothetical protein